MKLPVNPNSITLGDVEDFEEMTGTDLLKVMEPKTVICPGVEECQYEHTHKKGKPVPDPEDPKGRPLKEIEMPGAKALLALVFIFGRKTNPDLTREGVRKLNVTELEWVTDEEDTKGGDPTPPAAS